MDGRRQPTEGNRHVHLDIDTTWLEAVKKKADESLPKKPPSKPTIFRVPPSMRCANLHAYEPKLVSIGPYHRGKSMKAMEELKWRLLHNYLSRVPDGSRNEGLRKMKDLGLRARDCYSEVIDLDNDKFAEMLLLDGCFLVQILITEHALELESLLYGNMWFSILIFRDLFLLENQLPYFIIEHLLDTLPERDRPPLPKLVIDRFAHFLPHNFYPERKRPDPCCRGDHLLHLYHKWIVSELKEAISCGLEEARNTRSCSKLLPALPCSALSLLINKSRDYLSKVLPCCNNSSLSEELPPSNPAMTELVEAGVKIKLIKLREAKSFLNISFCKGVLEIPAICVNDHTNFLFANLVALEQSSRKHGLHVTHYTMFLDDIINTPIDVELLHKKGVIHRDLGSNEDIASLFNKLGNGVVYNSERDYLGVVRKGLNEYCQSRCSRWRRKAKHDYFNNPWAIISFVAAVLLLGLTILQSVYAVLDYYKK